MKVRWTLLLALIFVATLPIESLPALTQSRMTVPAHSSFAGIWEGKMDNFPAIDLTINEVEGKVSGWVLLYFQVGSAIPLLTPQAEGKALKFEVEDHRCGGCGEQPLKHQFRMELTGPDEATLRQLDVPKTDKSTGPGLKLVRRQKSTPWSDPSSHQVQFIIVEYGVRLEVLDWGGTGRPVVLLAGSGNTAHVFDDFALQLNGFCHVYGITRRGYGESSHPDTGYTQQRLAEDVLEVLNSLQLTKSALVGHSMAGEELTALGAEHSDRLAGLVYLDAASDPTDFPASSPAYMALYQNLPPEMRQHAAPSASDRKSFSAYRNWQMQSGGVPFPESELRNQYESNSDGSVGQFRTSPRIHAAIGAGALKRDYSRIRVPILALFPSSGDKPRYEPKNAQERAAIEAFDAATQAYILRWKKNLQKAPGNVRIIDLPGANHYIFNSNAADVRRELRDFLSGLH